MLFVCKPKHVVVLFPVKKGRKCEKWKCYLLSRGYISAENRGKRLFVLMRVKYSDTSV